MPACTYVIIDGFRFNACLGVCSGQCIAPDYNDERTREAVLNRNPEFLIALSTVLHDIDAIMILMDFWHLYPGENCEIDKYQEAARKVLQSPYASEEDRAGARKALNWSPSRYKRYKEPKRKEHGFVYVIQAPAIDPALYKIGREKVFRSRVDSLGIKLPWDLEVIVHIESEDYIGLEAELHQKFVDKRNKGEWFRLEDEDIEYLKGLENETGRNGEMASLLPE